MPDQTMREIFDYLSADLANIVAVNITEGKDVEDDRKKYIDNAISALRTLMKEKVDDCKICPTCKNEIKDKINGL